MEGGSIGGSGGNNDGIFKSVFVTECLHNVGDGRSLLSNSDIDAVELLLDLTGFEGSLLVKDGVDSDGGLTSLSISNDKLTLSSANGYLFKNRS